MQEKILSIPTPFGGALELFKNTWQGSKDPDEILSIVGGMHGDQVNGLYLNSCLSRFLDQVESGRIPDYRLKGKIQIFPIVHLNALEAGTSFWAFDNLDLDLAFPGNSQGEIAEQISAALFSHTRKSTYGLLLRTAPIYYEDAPHAQCIMPDRTVRKMAQGLGIETVRMLKETPVMRLNLLSQWRELEIPALSLSAGGPRILDRELCDSLLQGIVNVMVETGCLEFSSEKPEKTRVRVYKAADQIEINSSAPGMFVAEGRPGAVVDPKQKLGEIRDIISGQIKEEILAPERGFLVRLRSWPVIYEKEPVAYLLREKKKGFWPF